MKILAAIAAAALVGTMSPSSQMLYGESGDGYYVYKEDKSCVLYADYQSGTMMRLSYRTDEGVLYVMVVNAAWDGIVAGGSASLRASFPDLGQGHGFAAAVVDVDGRKGFSGIVAPEFLDQYARSEGLVLSIASADGSDELEAFVLDGGEEAVGLLLSCSGQYFPPVGRYAEAR